MSPATRASATTTGTRKLRASTWCGRVNGCASALTIALIGRNPQRECAVPPDGSNEPRSYGAGNDEEETVNTLNTPIVICYDRSAGSRRAIETTADLFPGKTAIVLHVWSPIAIIAAAYGGAVSIPTYDDTELQKAAVKVAEEGARVAAEAGLDAKPEIAEVTLEGTWHTILDIADEYDAGLIVLGARGLSTFKSVVLGSASHSVAQHAHRPVLIVPPPVQADKSAEAVVHAGAIA
jgi:nucleotide-binding universal stress UspA family protein